MSGGLETNPYDRGRGRGGRDRGMDCFRAKGHDYTRETSRDSSSVDENAIDDLLARLDSEYDTADEIRDQLMNQYSAGVTNRDKTWQTGGERAGAGTNGRMGSSVITANQLAKPVIFYCQARLLPEQGCPAD
mmetsp:Transcript_35378/g.40959  ORF Transcript_35378/g.40959 Transcript_35378/m.40959 type:complete len:132 (-) Transcript_35378:222-617(-)